MQVIQRINPAVSLLKDELQHRKMSQSLLASECGVSKGLVSDIVNGRKKISIEMALKLERILSIRAGLWLETQLEWELITTREKLQTA